MEVQNDKEDDYHSNVDAAEEFEFPLFATPTAIASTSSDERSDRGRTHESVMTVSMREPSEERIINERPASYYFAAYNAEEKMRFERAAITTEILFRTEKFTDPKPWKCIDLAEFNAAIKPKKHFRAGKKKRLAKIAGTRCQKERDLVKKKDQEEAAARLLKKKMHKRGGKKHKKEKNEGTGAKGTNTGGQKEMKQKEKPRFRTE